MKLPRKTKLSAAAPNKKEEVRAAFDPALVTQDDGTRWLIATNGHIAVAMLPVEVTADDFDGPLPLDAVIAAEKADKDEYVPLITAGKDDLIVKLSENDTLLAKRREQMFPKTALGIVLGQSKLEWAAQRYPEECFVLARLDRGTWSIEGVKS